MSDWNEDGAMWTIRRITELEQQLDRLATSCSIFEVRARDAEAQLAEKADEAANRQFLEQLAELKNKRAFLSRGR